MRLLSLLMAALVIGAAAGTARAEGERRVALVVGNNGYVNVAGLEKAVADAQAMADTLRSVGFEVIERENLDRRAMNLAVGEFVDKVSGGGVGLFYFAGHGVQIGGSNYLLPVDVPALRNQEDLRDEAIDLGRVLERVADAKAKLNIMIIDACRDNPFPRVAGRSIGGTRGLTIPSAPNGILIVYSAGVNETAIDSLGPGDKNPNGLFARELIPFIKQPGLRLYDAVREARKTVAQKAKAGGGQQNPAIYDQTDGDFYFVAQAAGAAQLASAVPVPAERQAAIAVPREAAPAPRPGFADLDALAAAHAWRELGERLEDIRPAERDRHWDGLAEQAATGELAALGANPTGPFAKRLEAIARYYPRYPSLAGSATFLALRAEVGLAAYRQCFEAGAPGLCRDHLADFVRAEPVRPSLALAAGHLVAVKLAQAAAAPFFGLAVAAGDPRACGEPGLADAAVAALGEEPGGSEAAAGRTLLERCWEKLRQPVLGAFGKESAGSLFMRNSCPALLAHKAVDGLRATRCQALAGNG